MSIKDFDAKKMAERVIADLIKKKIWREKYNTTELKKKRMKEIFEDANKFMEHEEQIQWDMDHNFKEWQK